MLQNASFEPKNNRGFIQQVKAYASLEIESEVLAMLLKHSSFPSLSNFGATAGQKLTLIQRMYCHLTAVHFTVMDIRVTKFKCILCNPFGEEGCLIAYLLVGK